MADNNKPSLSFNDFIQDGRRKKAAENLAQKLLGSKQGRRSSAPPTGPKAVGLGGSLASRVGVSKQRNSSLPRSNTPRGPRAVPPLTRIRSELVDRPSRPSSTRPEVGSRRNSGTVNGGGLSIRGAATSTSPVIIAQNFAPGTTAADIESVMLKVGGELTSCRLVASMPTVIVEMVFADLTGAENVVEQFNGKKADGRTLYVYRRDDGGARRPGLPPTSAAAAAVAQAPEPIPISSEDDKMAIDEAAEAREANDRMREERRGRDGRDDRDRDVFPSGPRGYMDDYRGGARRSEGGLYSDGRQGGFGGGGGGGRDGYAPRGPSGAGGGGRHDGRERNFGGGRSWRP